MTTVGFISILFCAMSASQCEFRNDARKEYHCTSRQIIILDRLCEIVTLFDR